MLLSRFLDNNHFLCGNDPFFYRYQQLLVFSILPNFLKDDRHQNIVVNYMGGQYIKHRITNTGTFPLVAIVTECHLDFPAYPHNYPAIFEPGKGNDIHQHDNRVEAFYVIQGPGAVVIADPDNTSTRELLVPERGAAYQPMYVYHRQFNPQKEGDSCYWIHSMVVYTHRGSRMPQVHIRQHELDGKTPLWEADSGL